MPVEMTRDAAQSLRAHFQQRHRDVLALVRELVERESPSGDGAGSREVVQLLEREARTIDGVRTVERIAARGDYGEHLRVRAFGDGVRDGETILLLGHTDTVHPRGTLRQRPWREEGGRIYGPGIFDMKASCAVALEVVRALSAASLAPRCPLVLLLTCDEETGSETGRALVEEEARRAAAVLVLEPPAPGGRAKTERKGTAGYTLTIEGRAAHAGLEPEKGVSAVLELARQIERLHALNDAARGTTINVGVIRGGTRSNVVPAEACAEIDVRFSTNDEAARIEAAILSLRPVDERVKLDVRGGINRPPLERSAAVLNLYAHAREVAALLGDELGEASVGGASDGNFAAAVGAAVLDGLGVEGDGAHAAHEHIVADSIARRGALLAALIASL
jgi:glutamate carboxypeptidase